MKTSLSLFFLVFVGVSLPAQINVDLALHARDAPDSIEANVEELTAYLLSEAESDWEKAEVIYHWIASNIEYDMEAYLEDVYFENFEETLARKRGVCVNFTSLFKKMCEIAKLECYEVSGYAKGYGFEKGRYYTQVNHKWNVVKIDSLYLCVDPTWGSGKYEDKSYGFEYRKRKSMEYFLVNPSSFVLEHLPVDPKWQFLERPITMEDFIWDKVEFTPPLLEKNSASNQVFVSYRVLTPIDQRIDDLENGIAFYYSDYLIEHLAILCYKEAYELSTNGTTKEDMERSIVLYQKSLENFREIEISYPKYKTQISDIADGITYSKYRLGRM
ncbi:transglutaminase domain-containing protein [Lewinella cohaerens]|uniref:transglutaminase domain-containing protein n=1 Tax=Lewinella cohaerens TaxID=70995 RepID=UPI0003819E0C|nr:transglutaminase domain-containing protein [Lewinella cohaerens]